MSRILNVFTMAGPQAASGPGREARELPAAGALLLRAADEATGLFKRVGACFTDHRESRLVEHSVETIVVHRIAGTGLARATAGTLR